MHGPDLSLILPRIPPHHCQKGMILVPRFSPERRHQLLSKSQRPPHHMALPGPGARQSQQLPLLHVHIHASRQGPLQIQRLLPLIDQAGASYHRLAVSKHTVPQGHLQPQNFVPAVQFQGHPGSLLPLPAEGSRQSRKFRLSLQNPASLIMKFTAPKALLVSHIQTAVPVIPHSPGRIFRRKGIRKRTFLPQIL